MEQLPGGYYRAQGRVDDTMNLGGIKIGPAGSSEPVATFPVLECAAVALAPSGGGPSRLVLHVVLESEASAPDLDDLRGLCQRSIRARLNPLFKVTSLHLGTSCLAPPQARSCAVSCGPVRRHSAASGRAPASPGPERAQRVSQGFSNWP